MPAPLPNIARDIDRVRDEFEAEWRAGRRPALEAYLERAAPVQRSGLLRELLPLEVGYRSRAGERPAVAEYQQRFPDQAVMVQEVLARPVPSSPSVALADSSVHRLTLTAVEGPHAGRVFTFLGHDIFLAGRSKEAHLRLTDRYFSRLHFMVEVNPPACRLTDLKSRNGTYVNGRRVPSADLHEGDVIKAGLNALRVSLGTAPPEPAADGGAAKLPDPAPPEPAAHPGEVAAPNPALPARPAAPTPVPGSSPPPGPDPGGLPGDPGCRRLGGYRLVRELGHGGMGIVYLAVREADGARVALKTVTPDAGASRNQVQRFVREAEILCRLRHPNIVAFREVGEADGGLFFAMDYVEGTDAGRLLKEHGPLPVRNAVRIACQVLAALDHAHGQRFVHRDIKPNNILVADEGGKKVVKLADFGLARIYQASRLSGLSVEGEFAGTLPFMAPEQITKFREVEPPADQYSAAATLYTLLTGQLLFDFQRAEVPPVALVLLVAPVPLRERRPDLPEGLADIIHRALAKQPGDRFPDVRTLRAALQPFGK